MQLLGNGTPAAVADGAIVGVVRGRQEWGPRALGHRSLLGAPQSAAAKDRMNRLKRREFYRPVSPMVMGQEMTRLLDTGEPALSSPFMSYAPRVSADRAVAPPPPLP